MMLIEWVSVANSLVVNFKCIHAVLHVIYSARSCKPGMRSATCDCLVWGFGDWRINYIIMAMSRLKLVTIVNLTAVGVHSGPLWHCTKFCYSVLNYCTEMAMFFFCPPPKWKWLYKCPVAFFIFLFLLLSGIMVLLTLTAYTSATVPHRPSLRWLIAVILLHRQ